MLVWTAILFGLNSTSMMAQEIVPVQQPPVEFILEDPIEFQGDRFEIPTYLITDPVRFSGTRFDIPTFLLTDSIEFHGAPELDLSRLQEMQAEIQLFDDFFDDWYTQGSMSESLIRHELTPDQVLSEDFATWLRQSIGPAFWDYSQESSIRSFFWSHHEALQSAIDELDRRRNPEQLRTAISYFENGMAQWRQLKSNLQGMYFDCYLPGMAAAGELYQTFRSLDWYDDRRGPIYELYQSTLHTSNDCVSARALANLTASHAFEWPAEGVGSPTTKD